jgi:hypothetical protein
VTRVGLYFGVVQFLFVSCWTVYVIYLPGLLAQAGIEKKWVIWVLMADQLIFTVMDFAIGIAADRVLSGLRRIGPWLLGATVVSGLAFLLLPHLAPAGAPALLAGAVVVWAVTSSALRAPPMMLLGKYVPPAGVPWVSTLSLVGLGLAGATAPYLTLGLRGVDPRLPFALASLALVAAVGGMLWAEKHLAAAAPAEPPPPARPLDARVVAFFAAVALLGLGFQMHFALNSAPLYLRFAKPPELDHLMPVFWIGFNLLIFPACRANQRFGGVPVMTAGAVLGALAAGAGRLGALAGNPRRAAVPRRRRLGRGADERDDRGHRHWSQRPRRRRHRRPVRTAGPGHARAHGRRRRPAQQGSRLLRAAALAAGAGLGRCGLAAGVAGGAAA